MRGCRPRGRTWSGRSCALQGMTRSSLYRYLPPRPPVPLTAVEQAEQAEQVKQVKQVELARAAAAAVTERVAVGAA